MFNQLHETLQALVFTFLSDIELSRMATVNRGWLRVLKRQDLWKRVFTQQYGQSRSKDYWIATETLPKLSWSDACLLLAKQKQLALNGLEFNYCGKWESARDRPNSHAAFTFNLFLTADLGSARAIPDEKELAIANFKRNWKAARDKALLLISNRSEGRGSFSTVVEVRLTWTLLIQPTYYLRKVGDTGNEYVLGYYHKQRRVLELIGMICSPGSHDLIATDCYQVVVAADGLSCEGVTRSNPPHQWYAPIYAISSTLQTNVECAVASAFDHTRELSSNQRLKDFQSMFP